MNEKKNNNSNISKKQDKTNTRHTKKNNNNHTKNTEGISRTVDEIIGLRVMMLGVFTMIYVTTQHNNDGNLDSLVYDLCMCNRLNRGGVGGLMGDTTIAMVTQNDIKVFGLASEEMII